MTKEEIWNATQLLWDFVEKICKPLTSVQIKAPDGQILCTDWGYFLEGLIEIEKYVKGEDYQHTHGGY